MNKKFSLKMVSVIVVFAVLITSVASILIFSVCYPSVFTFFGGADVVQRNLKLAEIQRIIDNNYIGEADASKLLDGVAEGMVKGLDDKYSAYTPKEEAAEQLSSYSGVSKGIGVNIVEHPDNGTIYICQVFEGSPAKTVGLEIGDEIVSVDGQTVAEIGYTKAVNLIGERQIGEVVDLVCLRNGIEFQLGITLADYDVWSVFGKVIDGIGYVQITTFNQTTAKQLDTVVSSLVNEGVTALVFDLRNNSGGLVDSVAEVLDYLMPEGTILTVKYKDESRTETYKSDSEEVTLPMAVLVNSLTASASELFTATLKESGKAVVIGANTYGKGVVQSTYTLSDGSLLKITVAKYYTGGGFCPDGVGVAPDIPIEWEDEELRHRIVNGIEKDKDFLAAVDYFTTPSEVETEQTENTPQTDENQPS